MEFVRFTDPAAFRKRALPFLNRNEVENSLMIGISSWLADDSAAPESVQLAPPLLCTVEGDAGPIAAMLMTPPHNLLLTAAPVDAIQFAAEQLRQLGVQAPGVLAPAAAAGAFGTAWTGLTGRRAQTAMAQRMYRLDQVCPPAAVSGVLAQATLDDLELVLRWSAAFHREVFHESSDVTAMVGRRVNRGEIYLWRNRGPVSMAGATRPTGHGICVNYVYTPPEHRRLGYASAAVAALSQRLLDSGREWCALFTDLANATSNKIYAGIGYRPVCDFQEYRFVG